MIISSVLPVFTLQKNIIVLCVIQNKTLINISAFIVDNILILKSIILKCFNFIIIN